MSGQELREAGQSSKQVIRAAGAVDGTGVWCAPAVIVTERDEILAVGSPHEIGAVGEARVLDASGQVVIPGLVNSHCHLDLTHIGPLRYEGDFSAWLQGVRSQRAVTSGDIRDSVHRGASLSRRGGTVLVGDIAGGGNADSLNALRETGLGGVSFQEVFGVGKRQEQAIQWIETAFSGLRRTERGVMAGLEPHAPYSCGMQVYEACARKGGIVATHLAESLEEIEFTEMGTGFFVDMLTAIGVWDDSIRATGQHPVDLLVHVMAMGGAWLAAHVQYIEHRHLEVLERLGVTVAYCPRASAYFGHPSKSGDQAGGTQRWIGADVHPYRAMLKAGVKVALGTDSILCLGSDERISVLDEMRLLHQRDGTGVQELIRMATVAGACALGIDPGLVSLRKGRTAGLLGVGVEEKGRSDPIASFLKGPCDIAWLHGPFDAKNDWFDES